MTKAKLTAGALIGVAAAIAAVVFSHCSGDGPPPLRIAYQNRVGSALFLIAADLDYFAAEGLDVRTHRFASGPACSEALYSGAVDVATMGDATAVIALSRRPDLRIVGSHGCGEHRHRIIVSARAGIRSPQDLRGKRLAVKKGTSTYGGLLKFMRANGLEPGDMDIIDMSPSCMSAVLASGSADAIVASEPTPSLAEAAGGTELGTLGNLGNCYPILVMTSDRILAERRDAVVALLRGLVRAETHLRDRPAESLEIVARETGLEHGIAAVAMKRHDYRLRLDAAVESSLTETAQFLLSTNTIRAVPRVRGSLERGVVESAMAPVPAPVDGP